MKTVVVLFFALLAYQSSTAQLPNYYQQGYNTGCQLGTGYSQGVTSNYTIYINTISNPNFPTEYKNGVREGWAACRRRSGDLGCPDNGCDWGLPDVDEE